MENSRQHKIKKGALLFLMGIMLVPIVQDQIGFARIKPLGGWAPKAPEMYFSGDGWFSGDYQKGEEAWLNQQFGLRNVLVRFHNQLDYWLFKHSNAQGFIYGKNGYLFDKIYTDAFYGINYLGDKKIDSITDQIKYLQDRLEQDGKTFLMVFAAGKATYFEEYIPDEYKLPKTNSNYLAYQKAMEKKGINHIDFNKWFHDNKTKSPYPLYPQLGIHWSVYGSAVAFDSIQKWIEAKRHIDMPDFRIRDVELPDTTRPPDDDVWQTMNLLFHMPFYKMAYPVLEMKNDSSKYKPTVITVGDSFWWNIYNFGVNDGVFNSGQFFYYNQEFYRGGTMEKRLKENIDFNREIAGTEIIIFCYTEGTVHDMGNGFLTQLNDYYKGRSTPPVGPHAFTQQDIDNFEKYIRGDKTWLGNLQKESKEKGIPLDTLIRRDARWQAENIPRQ
jgi:hypothetical protein